MATPVSQGKAQTVRLPDGRRLGYAIYGSLTGKPVICFHGFPGCRWDFAFLDGLARRQQLQLICFDRPGVGLSSLCDERPVEAICWDVAQLIRHLGLTKPALLGVSGGGPFALACAAGLKECAGAVIVGGLGRIPGEEALRGMNLSNKGLFLVAMEYPRLTALPLWGASQMMKHFPSFYLKNLRRVLARPDQGAVGGQDEKAARHTVQMGREIFAQGTKGLMREAASLVRPWKVRLNSIKCPVYLWHGAADRNVPLAMAKDLAQRIPGSVLHIVPREGHLLFSSHSEDILKCLASLWEKERIPAQKAPRLQFDRNIDLRYDEFTVAKTKEVFDMDQYQIETKCVQAGYEPKNGEPRVLPIAQSTTFKYDSAETLGNLFDLKEDGFFYTRLANPTVDAVEKKIAQLEGGVGALLTSSGQAATLMSVTNICHAGGHVICASAVYGGTFNLFNKTLRELGIDFTFMLPETTEEQLNAAFRENTRCVFIETVSNPSLVVTDIEMYARAAHAHGVPLIVDNTFPTPINCRPIAFGADIVTHSTSKYMDGHAVALGGVIVDSGNFDWKNSKFTEFTQPDESYHGAIYAEQFGRAAYITKARAHLMRDLGAQASPMNAFLLNLGLETLFLRVERHCANAQAVAEYLENHEKIAWVNYPGLKSSPYYNLAQKYMPKGTCGVISFGVKGGKEAAVQFMEGLKLASIVIHVADARTSVLHPASTTHRQMTDEQLQEAGVGPDMIRMSVGIENVQDIIADLEQSLAKL